ncbi:MAG: double-strand break repair helicase AddA [Pseudomonadota bacterium]
MTFRNHDDATLAQTRAARPGWSAWVSANAGSGKTRVLTNRVARLLLAGAEPSRILCLTYTKAAAAEMQNRLFDTLGRWAMATDADLLAAVDRILADDEPPPSAEELEEARRLFAKALETPGGLKIQTIHAFCESLLSRFPLEARVSPHFQVIDESLTADLLAEARDAVIATRAEDPTLADAFERLLLDLKEIGLSDMMAEITAKRAAFAAIGERPEAQLAQFLQTSPNATTTGVLEDWASQLDRRTLSQLATVFGDSDKTTNQTFAAAFRGAAQEDDPQAAYETLTPVLLTTKGEPRTHRFPTKDVEDAHPWVLEALKPLQDGVLATRAALGAADRLDASAKLAEFAAAVLREYQDAKARRAGLDYDDLIERAVGLLNRSEARDWVRYKLDGGIEHVLVDEAQDTSPRQWEAITALAEEFFSGEGAHEARTETPRTLFAVGDEKQSIYSFQGAEPRLFAEKGEAFAQIAAASGRYFDRAGLATSFRSVPAILDFVDRVFADPAAANGLTFGATGVMHEAFRKDQPGVVELWPLVRPLDAGEERPWWEPLDAPPPDDPQARLAMLVAQQIKNWIGREDLPARGRKIRAGDIIVLVRRRSALSNGIIARLKQFNVPVAGVDRLALGGQLAVKDLLALARFCLNPEDDLALATVLRSPFCDVDEEMLFDLAHKREGDRRLYYELISRKDDRPEFRSAHAFLAELVKIADYQRPYEFFAKALGPMGMRRRLVARLGAEATDPMDELIGQTLTFESAGAPTLEGFVEWISKRDSEIKREHEQGHDEVRVMTAHGAKGLEAPVVILPDTTGAPTGARQPTLLSPEKYDLAEPGTPPIWLGRKDADPPSVRALRDAHAEREAEEHRRLLYVALTRAEDRLLICGAAKKQAPTGSWYALCEAASQGYGEILPSPVLDENGTALKGWRHAPGGDARAAPEKAETRSEALLGETDWLHRHAASEEAPADISPSRLGGDDPEAEGKAYGSGSGFDAERAKKRGILIHMLLEELEPLAPDIRAEAAGRFLAGEVDFTETQRADMTAEALRVFDMPEAGFLFGEGSRAEAPIAGVLSDLGPGEIHGFIDRLVVDQSRVLIVDFKTGGAPETPPEGYLRQLAVYRAVLTRLYPDRRIDAALLWTAAPRLQLLDAEDLDAAFGRAAAQERDRRRASTVLDPIEGAP